MTDTTPGTDLTFATSSLNDRIQWSRAIAGAGNLVPVGFRDGPNANPAKILLAVEYGAMLGLHPMAALSGIHVIEGKPTLSAALMSALVHKAGHKLRITTTGAVTGTGTTMGGDFTVTVTLIRADDPSHPFTVTWTIDRAKRAGLWGKGNWVKYPENQMTWRGVSEATKLGAPEVLSGVWYTPDELGATVDEDGDVLEGEVVEQDHDGRNVQAAMRPEPARSKATATSAPKVDAESWVQRITSAPDINALRALRGEAVAANVLLEPHDGHLLGEWFDRQRDILNQATAGEPEVQEPSPAVYEDSDVPF